LKLNRKPISSILVLALGLTLVPFQNCGSPGFETDADGGLTGITSAQIGVHSRFAQAPFPFEYNLNHFAYMTCPMAGDASEIEPSFFNRPFFSVRAGAYDNLDYANEFGLSSDVPQFERSNRLQAGIRIRPEFIDYLQTQFKRSDSGIIFEGLREKLHLKSIQPHIALVNIERSRMQGGFGWDYGLIRPALIDVSDSRFLSSVADAPRIGSNFQLQRFSHFSQLDPAHRSIAASMSWGKSEADLRLFSRELRNNLMVTSGFSDVGADNIMKLYDGGGFSGADNVSTIAGRGYRLRFSNHAPQGGSMSALEPRFLVGIEESNISQRPYQNLYISEGQDWECFSLILVRRIDRVDPADPHGRPYCWRQAEGSACGGVQNGEGPHGSVINGVRYACPTQTVASLNQQVIQNGTLVRLNRIRMEMARRVLPAEYWEINTNPNHMCAVPTSLAISHGKCYASGDSDANRFIQYNNIQNLPTGSRPCGPNGGNECPAHVSICYRKQ